MISSEFTLLQQIPAWVKPCQSFCLRLTRSASVSLSSGSIRRYSKEDTLKKQRPISLPSSLSSLTQRNPMKYSNITPCVSNPYDATQNETESSVDEPLMQRNLLSGIHDDNGVVISDEDYQNEQVLRNENANSARNIQIIAVRLRTIADNIDNIQRENQRNQENQGNRIDMILGYILQSLIFAMQNIILVK